ncbi:hypothetical protein Leryth_020928 [Lithospermum erythrorhizon]|nr:hypothetical protein Leryth_020928 [Lithospermum erythrorhizon]
MLIICFQVHSFNLTEIQKDYLSLDKRYPRLLVSPDCSKVVVHWPKGKLKVSYNTPVSFEHDFVQRKDSVELKGSSGKQLPYESGKDNQCTVWNAKVVLMSGLSQNALEDLLSDRNHGSRVPHLCNMLRFAILKKSSSFTMIGGPWDPVDGGDPSSDESSLICTALRYAKELTNLDLKDCQHWNRFLEIHYDRIGKNGLFSHKEVTVIFLPDLTDCLPSLNTWRNQWLAYKKATIEREQQHSLRNEKPSLKKESVKDEADSLMKEANEGKQPEIKEEASPMKTECELKAEDGAHQAGSGRGKIIENIDGVESVGTKDGLKGPGEGTGSKTAQTTNMVKKKIIKKVVKQKVVDKKDGVENSTRQGVVGFEKGTNEQTAPAEVTQKQDGPSSGRPSVKTLVRKKIVKKVPVRKISKEGGDTLLAVTVVKELEPPKDVSSGSAPLGQESGVKTTTKRKIIKRVPKKKVSPTDANNVVADVSIIENMEVNSAQADKEQSQTSGLQNLGKLEQKNSDSKVENDVNTKLEPNEVISEKVQLEDKKMTDEKVGSAPKVATETGEENRSSKDLATSKDGDLVKEKERSPHDRKDESQAKKIKDVKDQKMREEPPRHPGLLLQTKGTKDSKLQSLSLSLDSLLDYTEKDIEESTFEVSLFAESLYEMLQYEMGCRIFLFLQKLRLDFITKRNRRKRGRDEISKRESGKTTPEKRAKKDAVDGDNPSIIAVKDEADTDKNVVVKENTSSVNAVKEIDMHASVKEEEDPEEDPDEDPEEESEEEDPEEPEEDPEEEEMPDANASLAQDIIKEENVEMGHIDAKVENSSDGNVQPSANKVENSDGKVESSAVKVENSSDGKVEPSAARVDSGLKEQVTTSVTMPGTETNGHKTVERNKKPRNGEMDKELLQAFRFFDRNRAGYIRVEDMRVIIHSLGKCLPHRDVKELVISALLESNTGRNDHILYEKLIRIGDRKVQKSKN